MSRSRRRSFGRRGSDFCRTQPSFGSRERVVSIQESLFRIVPSGKGRWHALRHDTRECHISGKQRFLLMRTACIVFLSCQALYRCGKGGKFTPCAGANSRASPPISCPALPVTLATPARGTYQTARAQTRCPDSLVRFLAILTITSRLYTAPPNLLRVEPARV